MREVTSADIRAAMMSEILPNPMMRNVAGETRCPAAVLVPILIKDTRLSLLLTKRRANLAHHGGEISFPGGRFEATDRSMQMTALRECQEEIGLTSDYIELCGALPDHPAGRSYIVSPLVGLVHPGHTLRKQDNEVEEIFDVPLSFFMDDSNRSLRERTSLGTVWTSYQFLWEGRDIWGATAGIIVSLIATLMAYLKFPCSLLESSHSPH